MDKKEMKTLVNELKKNGELALSKEFGDDVWSKFWFDKTLETIRNANARIQSLVADRMLIFDPSIEIRPFWQNIMQTVQKSIWTTNIASRITFGNVTSEELLMLQKAAIQERGVEIIRLFVYDAGNPVEVVNLRSTMNTQLFYGITVFAIPKNVFDNKSTNTGEELGSDDLMIIDNQFVYENKFNSDTASWRNTLVNSNEQYESKKKIADNLMKFAISITTENVNQFPNIL